MMIMSEIIARHGNEDELKHDLGDGYELVTRHIVRLNDVSVEYELYKDGARVYNPDMLDEDAFPDDKYEAYKDAVRAQKSENWMISVESGVLENKFGWVQKPVWYAVGDTYQIKDKLKEVGMVWESGIKMWASLKKPEIEGVEFVQMNTYKKKNEWSRY